LANLTHLEGTGEGVKEHGKEEQSTTSVETACVVRQVVENTSNNQGHNEVTNQLGHGQTGITFETLETTDHAQLDLLPNGNGVGGFDSPAESLAHDT